MIRNSTHNRQRILILGFTAIVVVLGLASRRFHFLFPAVLGKYPGDALWAVMVYLLVLLVKPSYPMSKAAWLAFVISVLDEFSQSYHTPALDRFRSGTLGHLILGSQFSWLDILAYGLGIVIVYGIHRLFLWIRK